MSRVETRTRNWVRALLLGLWVVLGQGHDVYAKISYSGLWDTREGDDGRLWQSYDHSLKVEVDQEPTARLSSGESLNYRSRWDETGNSEETLSPGALLSLHNDLFQTNLSVTSVRALQANSNEPDSDTVGLLWASRWQKKWFPSLRVNYDYGLRKSTLSSRHDEESRQGAGAEIDWDLQVAKVFYSYRRDQASFFQYETVQDSHFAKITTDRSWWDGRLRLQLGQEYTQSISERLISFKNGTEIPFPVYFTDILAGIDPYPDDSDYSMLVPNRALNDHILIDRALTVTPAAQKIFYSFLLYVPLSSGKLQQVDHIYIYTKDNLTDPSTGLVWRVYSNSDPQGLEPWVLETIQLSYDQIEKKYDIFVISAQKKPLLKVVLDVDTSAPASGIIFTEIEGVETIHGAVGTTSQTSSDSVKNKSSVNLSYQMTKSFGIFYSFLTEDQDQESKTISSRQTHSAVARYQNLPGDLLTTLAFNRLLSLYADNPELQMDSYQLTLTKKLLPTLSIGFGGAHDEASRSGLTLYTRDRYSFYADGLLYPDLNSKLDVAYWLQDNAPATGAISTSDDLRTSLTITSRFRPSLTVSLSDVYEVQNQDKLQVKGENLAGLSATWQCSDQISLSGSVLKADSKIDPGGYSYTLSTTFALTQFVELKGNYGLTQREVNTQFGQVSLRWSSRSNVTMELGCNYADSGVGTDQNLYEMYSRVGVNFATN